MYREGFPKNPLKLVWGENKAARDTHHKKVMHIYDMIYIYYIRYMDNISYLPFYTLETNK